MHSFIQSVFTKGLLRFIFVGGNDNNKKKKKKQTKFLALWTLHSTRVRKTIKNGKNNQ